MSLHTPVWKRSWPFVILTLFFVLGATYLQVFWRSRQSFIQAESLLEQGQLEQAIRQYGRTVRWYIPGNRYTAVAAERLLKISEITYQRGKWEQAIMALQHLRNALSSIRSLYQPYASTLLQAKTRLAESLSLVNHSRDHRDRQSIRSKLLEILQRDPSPPLLRTLFASVMYGLWLCTMGILIWYWRVLSRRQKLWLFLGHLGMLCSWMWGLLA